MAFHSTSPATLREEMHVELEFMPGKRRLLPTSHAGVRLAWDREDGTFRGGSSFGFGLTRLQKKHSIFPG